MSIKDLTYRDMRKEDIDEVCNLLNRTWDMEGMVGSELVEGYCRLYIESVLADSSVRIVAEKAGKLIGVIMGEAEADFRLDKNHFDKFKELTDELSKRNGGMKLINSVMKLRNTYSRLYVDTGVDFDGYISFLALDNSMRGKGIGKKLLELLKEKMDENGVKKVCVFTDTTCNVEFYEKQGFTRKKSSQEHVEFVTRCFDINVYLYEYDFPDRTKGN